ncbi:hypothetical protein [Marinobacter xiaoshiensis]|uniref:Uncharacterized protein n=1 Tax=Marinobacter xiaoshiensis TaxID=3073652 RepID=A0ABU2HKW3_9GAMM|nr:hypothetical protein [Marinobacter sp. F60267]MDS1311216.1 hypothetical protein [Marinobacter sp. F60267]
MAIKWTWEKRKPEGLSGFKNREMLWLWCRLEANGYILNSNLVSDADSRANHLIDNIADNETFESLRFYRDECFSNSLDSSEFDWINYNDKRLVHWLFEMIWGGYTAVTVASTSFDQSALKPREVIELAFDLNNLPIKVKKEVINNLRNNWSLLIEVDPGLEWVDKENEDQCRWLVDEIRKSDLAPYISPDLQSPVDNEDRFLLFVNTLDRTGMPLKPKKLFLSEMKAKWRRKNKKADAKKVQCNLNVLSSTKEYIEKIANDRSLKMGELIDALIAEEMKRKY